MPAIVALIVQILPLLIATGEDAAPFILRIMKIDADTPTDEDWQAVHDMETRLRATPTAP